MGKCHDEACRVFSQREGLRQASERVEAPFEGFSDDKKEIEQKPFKVEPNTASPRIVTHKEPEIAKHDSNEVGELPESGGDQTSEQVKAPSTTEKDRKEKIEKGKAAAHWRWQNFAKKRGADEAKAWRGKQSS